VTFFPGNMALGATGSAELAQAVGAATGRELAAMGFNINYAPVCDVLDNPENTIFGIRSFGEDPALAGRLAAALVAGLQSVGVAATAKHFPGHGNTAADSHYTTPILMHDEARLRQVELVPFEAAVRAGVKLVMTAHVALPRLHDGEDLLATLSPVVLRGLLRRDLGFEGVIVSDALDMHAITQGRGLLIDALAAAAAGVDLLLLGPANDVRDELYAGLLQAARRRLLPVGELMRSAGRVLALRQSLAGLAKPPLDVVGCVEHRALAREVAGRAVTLVRDEAGRLPLRLQADARVAAAVVQPVNLTPADTSGYVTPAVGDALRHYHPRVDDVDVPFSPSEEEAAALADRLAQYDLVVMATINAVSQPGQAAVVNRLLERGVPLIVAALRLPYDLVAFPAAPTYLCTYSLLLPSVEALAAVLWGQQAATGSLPVSIPGLYPAGHRAAVKV
jgi:beta-N-acetylhexosaminidase